MCTLKKYFEESAVRMTTRCIAGISNTRSDRCIAGISNTRSDLSVGFHSRLSSKCINIHLLTYINVSGMALC